jgi:Zinc finger, C3HC4 type (RING finger)
MKGHQNDKGRIIATGPYESDFMYNEYYDTWMADLEYYIEALQNEFQLERDHANEKHELPDEVLVLRQHSTLMSNFYSETNQAEFRSHSTCVSCFAEMSIHALPCGHVLCTPCVKGYGKTVNKLDFNFKYCPLHPEQTRWVGSPFTIRFKPDFAGVRLLSLDGYIPHSISFIPTDL